jgi:biopolymer transport protein ExbD
MHNRKLRRQNLKVDMAAMCDVALLILIFFILCSTPKAQRPVDVGHPLASGGIYDPDDGNFKIVIAPGKMMVELESRDRAAALVKMGEKYHISFTAAELAKFNKIENIGVPMAAMKQFIDGYYNAKAFMEQPGIRMDLKNNELFDWLTAARLVSRTNQGRDLSMIIDADKSAMYPEIKNAINTLVSQKIFKFDLMHDTKHSKTVI